MTGITHQLVALLAALWVLTIYPVSVGPVVGIIAVMAVMIGALTPDLDQPTANIWRRMLGGWAIGKIFNTFSGGHRHITHSFIGIALVGWLLWIGIHRFFQPQYVNSLITVWYAFMIGYISHPIADTLTDRGVPWFWPLPWNIKVPPGPEEVRVTTESIVELVIVRIGIIVAAGFLLTTHWQALLNLFK